MTFQEQHFMAKGKGETYLRYSRNKVWGWDLVSSKTDLQVEKAVGRGTQEPPRGHWTSPRTGWARRLGRKRQAAPAGAGRVPGWSKVALSRVHLHPHPPESIKLLWGPSWGSTTRIIQILKAASCRQLLVWGMQVGGTLQGRGGGWGA